MNWLLGRITQLQTTKDSVFLKVDKPLTAEAVAQLKKAWQEQFTGCGHCKDCKWWNKTEGWCGCPNPLAWAEGVKDSIVCEPEYGCVQFEAKE